MKKPKILILIFSILLFFLILKESYAYFGATNQSISQLMTTGEIIYDVIVDTNPNYIENNIAYFRVKVTNTKQEKTTTIPFKYKLTLQNEENSNGIFYYIDSEGNTSSESGEYLNTITSQEYTFDTNEETREFKVYVKVPSGLKENVDFKIGIESKQFE